MTNTLLGYQFVWWGWRSWFWGKSHACEFGSMNAIYKWAYCFGPLEVRKWTR